MSPLVPALCGYIPVGTLLCISEIPLLFFLLLNSPHDVRFAMILAYFSSTFFMFREMTSWRYGGADDIDGREVKAQSSGMPPGITRSFFFLVPA